MAYKEPKIDKEGAKAIYDAFTKMNDGNTKSSNKTKTKKKTTKK